MKLLIQGRNNGYIILYPKPTPKEFYSFASDIQSINANNYDKYYGKYFYTIAFVDGGCIFTKYVIGDDVGRGQLGEIGISAYVSNTQKLSGADVKALLDELINTFCRHYIFDNKIDEPKNGFDWLLFTSLANGYDAKLISRPNINDIDTRGTQDPAFHYYKSDNELIEHFDRPFQEEYSDYKQIFFIDNNLQGTCNPLNVLRNSGAEVNPDLNNEYCYFNNYDQSKCVTITAIDNSRAVGKNNNKIRPKWKVEIKYVRDYYKPIVVTGSISNPASDIHRYLERNGNNIKILYNVFRPDPETKTVSFDVVTKRDRVKVTDVEIQVDSQPWKYLSNVTFTAEELGSEHKIAARKGDNLFSDVVKITPKDFKETSLLLPLKEKKIVKFIVTEADGERNNIPDFTVWVSNGKCNTQKVSEVTFTGDEIYETWNITVEKDGYTPSIPQPYCPKNGRSTINFELKKANKQPPRDKKSPRYPSSPQIKEQPKSFAKKLITFFSKPAGIATLIVSAIILGVGIWALFHFLGNDKQTEKSELNNTKIEMYVEGDSLMLDKLKVYKENWEKQEEDFIAKSGGGWFGGEEKADSAKWKSYWQPANESIDRAIKKRELINNKNIEELGNQRYSTVQQSFITAIEKIDSTKYAEVGEELGDVKALTLTQIAEKINEILKSIEPVKEEARQESKGKEKKPVQKNETSEKNNELKELPNSQGQQTAAADDTSEIIQHIKGSEMKKETLNQYLNEVGNNATLKASINLCLKLWSLDANPKNSYYSYKEELSKDTYLIKSDLKTFVDEMNKNPRYIKYLPAQDQKKSLSDIKSKLK